MSEGIWFHSPADGQAIEVRPKGDHAHPLVTLNIHRSAIDGALIFQLDTDTDTGRIRIYVNDGAVFDANPEKGDHHPIVGPYATELIAALGEQIAI